MAKAQKVYTKEFKQEAVRLAQTSGKAIGCPPDDLVFFGFSFRWCFNPSLDGGL